MAEEAEVTTEETGAEETASEATSETTQNTEDQFDAFGAFSRLREGIQDESLRKQAERFQSFDDVVKANLDQHKIISKAIIPPDKDAKPSEVAAYRKKIGVPDTADDYAVDVPEGMEEEVFQSDAIQSQLKGFAELAHANNVSADAFKAMAGKYFEMMAEAENTLVSQDENFVKESEAALKQKWGPRYKTEVEFANRGFEFAAADNLDALKEIKLDSGRPLMDHPFMIEAMNKIGRAVSEDGGVSLPANQGDVTNLRADLERLTSEQADAMARGEHHKAQALDLDIMEIARKISGDNPIVGDGRAA